ncbi:MAG: hypothetical protein M5U28_12175 [Sandaracinaceae bacterium]|nr:hypothetical protein [Sandaracinaceae bacterium]
MIRGAEGTMKNGRQATSLCVVAVLLGVAGSASAQGVPQTMTVQGILRDAEGVPIEESTTFRFELLDGTTVAWEEEHTIVPRAGLFTLTLGREAPIDAALFVDRLSLRVTVADEAMDPIALTSVPYAFRAESVERYDGDVSWGQLTELPEGFADGSDDGNTYAAGTGLTLADDTFVVDPAVVQSRVSGTCAAGQSIRAIAQDGTVICEIDDIGPPSTTYTAGLGLTLTGTQFDVDPAVMQARVTATCPAGQAIRAIAAGGTVTCEPDDDTNYAAGTGLTLTGTTFAMDPALVQARVSSSCAAGSAIRAIAADGTVTCEVPAMGASYSAGAGLTLTGTTFAVDTASVQARVASTCPAGSSIRAIAADGTVMCEIDDDTDTTYAAGAGLTLSGTTFAVDPTAIQARVTGTCPAGQVIRGVNTDGTVTCGGATSGWLARSSGGVGQIAAWTSIPGLSVTIDLPGAARVSLLAVGTQRHMAGSCHVGYRYVVDGVARGDASWGQQLQVSGPNSWHAGFTVHDFRDTRSGHAHRECPGAELGYIELVQHMPGVRWNRLRLRRLYARGDRVLRVSSVDSLATATDGRRVGV